MKLTAQAIERAPTVVAPGGYSMLELRGQQIPYLENLAATGDSYEVIDLVDNELTVVENVPRLEKLKGLLLSNNRISRLEQSVSEVLPNLEWLALGGNRIRLLGSLVGLEGCEKLQEITLRGNDVTTDPEYRIFLAWLVPSLRVIDFEKVTLAERRKGTELYGQLYQDRSATATAAIERSVVGSGTEEVTKNKDGENDGENQAENDTKEANIDMDKPLDDEERARLVKELENALSLQEIEAIEALLRR